MPFRDVFHEVQSAQDGGHRCTIPAARYSKEISASMVKAKADAKRPIDPKIPLESMVIKQTYGICLLQSVEKVCPWADFFS